MKQRKCSIDEEMLMWTSYRYCIGRKTYVNTLANYIASHYYPILSDERKQFTAKDIKDCINQVLFLSTPSLCYNGNVSYDNRDGLDDLIKYLNENVNGEKDLIGIKSIEVIQKSYTNPEKYFETSPLNRNRTILDFDLQDLLIWYNLAQCFNIKDYKKVWYKTDSDEASVLCFKTWMNKYIESEDGFHYRSRFKYEERYIPITDYLSNPSMIRYINPDSILKIEDYVPTK
jgi:hypothetical protein